jgi:cysteine desulfurase
MPPHFAPGARNYRGPGRGTADAKRWKHRLPNTLNVSFVNRIGGDILGRLNGIAASTGSACHSGRIELSPVLQAMGVAPQVGIGAVRFSLGRGTTQDEIQTVVDRLTDVLATAE